MIHTTSIVNNVSRMIFTFVAGIETYLYVDSPNPAAAAFAVFLQ